MKKNNSVIRQLLTLALAALLLLGLAPVLPAVASGGIAIAAGTAHPANTAYTSTESSRQTVITNNYSGWAEEELIRALEQDLIPDSLKDPAVDYTQPVTRAEFAGIAVKTYENIGKTAALPTIINPFSDTKEIDALKAYNTGLMVGVSETEFAPGVLLNREQAATALTRVLKRATMPGWTFATDADYPLTFERPDPFTDDSSISDWAKDSVYFMVANGIILGVGDNMFAPRAVTSDEQARGYATATREQALIIALRMVENMN